MEPTGPGDLPASSSSSVAADRAPTFRELLSMLPEPALLTRGYRICFVNEAGRRLFGVESTWLLGRSPLELLHPDASAGAGSGVSALLDATGVDEVVEQILLRPDGDTRIVETRIRDCDDGGEEALLFLIHDVTGLRRLQADLLRSRDELRQLAIGLDSIQEGARQRIASELHDELQQTLAAIRMELGALGARFAPQTPDAARALAGVSALALAAMESTRRIVNDLRPPILEELGLEAALGALVAQFGQRTGIAACFESFCSEPDATRQLPPVATCLYRTAQEALVNVARHAHATTVRVRLECGSGGTMLSVADDGDGMLLEDRRRPFTVGLLAMQERLRSVGGTLRLTSRPGAGTTVEAGIGTAPSADPPADGSPLSAARTELEDVLLRSLYRLPVGLLEADLDGRIEMMNPFAARLLMPFSRDGRLDNLFTVLADAAPQLGPLVAGHREASGVVCEATSIVAPVAAGEGREAAASLSVVKQDGARLMVVLQSAR